ncbi:hypothetical protein G8C92_05410 [Paenibacillus donghaensis]|uniref:hypothetical protein n=1 Tax=Paenibacillus donghaensis TaxID=414771 RepID=UPI0018834A50|nr:hypothetical protein [Paenibacillus donghaensis]MBE9913464.1 hypothetical protein [Paenibacillus donghaensis]
MEKIREKTLYLEEKLFNLCVEFKLNIMVSLIFVMAPLSMVYFYHDLKNERNITELSRSNLQNNV